MNTPSLSLKTSESNGDVPASPPIIRMEFPPIGTPERCPFSVEVAPTHSNSFDHLQLSTISRSWSLAMKTTTSNLLDKGEIEEKGDEKFADDDEYTLNEIERALSKERAPVGLVRISSDSESSSRGDSVDVDSEDEDRPRAIHAQPTPAALKCDLSPRLSKTLASENLQNKQKATQGSSAPLDSLKVLNPGVPQGHASHRHHRRQHSYNSITGNPRTPKRGDNNALVTTNSNVANTSATDCMCFAIEDVAAFFCPVTPKSLTVDATVEVDCFPVYDYGATPSRSGDFGSSFPSITEFWASPNNSPLPRSREEQFEAYFLLNAKLPRNRGHSLRQTHVKKILTVWHGEEYEDIDVFRSRDDFHLLNKRQRKRNLSKPKVCYDSDPEQEVRGRWDRRSILLASKNRHARSFKPDSDEEEPHLLIEDDVRGKQQPRFRKFRPEPFTHLDTDVESSSEDDDYSYETAKCVSSPPSRPVAPRNSDPKISFDFGKNLSAVNVDGESDYETESIRQESKLEDQNGALSNRRDLSSVTSSSTTGHSRYHTIHMSTGHVQEESVSSESSFAGHSSLSESSRLQKSFIGAGNQRHTLPSYFKSYPTHWTEFQLLFSRNVDEDSIKSHVHELSNVRFPLVWHPAGNSPASTSNTKKTEGKASTKKAATSTRSIHCSTSDKIASLSSNADSNESLDKKAKKRKGTSFPISVNGAFEVGAHLEHMVVQPKFTWMPLTQPHRVGDEDANHRELFLNGSAPPQVELLSIIRVGKAKSLDRTLYPYARLDRTCIVCTNDANHPTIVLEARTTQERDWMVFALKLIVARLASIIITRDEDMLHEFFSPYSALMQIEDEEEEESASESQCAEKSPASPTSTKSASSHFECESTPTATCGKAVVLMDEEGPEGYAFPQGTEAHGDVSVNDCTTDSGIDNLGDIETDDEDDDCYQNRDDLENEDSIRARNAGAYAILKRSLSATGPITGRLIDDEPVYHHEDHMPRTLSY